MGRGKTSLLVAPCVRYTCRRHGGIRGRKEFDDNGWDEQICMRGAFGRKVSKGDVQGCDLSFGRM